MPAHYDNLILIFIILLLFSVVCTSSSVYERAPVPSFANWGLMWEHPVPEIRNIIAVDKIGTAFVQGNSRVFAINKFGQQIWTTNAADCQLTTSNEFPILCIQPDNSNFWNAVISLSQYGVQLVLYYNVSSSVKIANNRDSLYIVVYYDKVVLNYFLNETNMTWRYKDSSVISAIMADKSGNGNTYLITGDVPDISCNVKALNPSGEVIWEYDNGGIAYTTGQQCGQWVIIQDKAYFHLLNISNGTIAWQRDMSATIDAYKIGKDCTIYSLSNNSLIALDPASGNISWVFKLDTGANTFTLDNDDNIYIFYREIPGISIILVNKLGVEIGLTTVPIQSITGTRIHSAFVVNNILYLSDDESVFAISNITIPHVSPPSNVVGVVFGVLVTLIVVILVLIGGLYYFRKKKSGEAAPLLNEL